MTFEDWLTKKKVKDINKISYERRYKIIQDYLRHLRSLRLKYTT